MKYALFALALVGALSVSITASRAATEVVDVYTSGNYRFICIMKDNLRYCGNWNVVAPLPADT